MADHIAVFSRAPEQVGTPEIYDKPANRFVADIGDINFLDATVHDAGSVEVGKIFRDTRPERYGRSGRALPPRAYYAVRRRTAVCRRA